MTLDHQPPSTVPISDHLIVTQPDPVLAATFSEQVEQACSRVAPLWPLQNFVAVNPFVGLADRHFLEAAELMPRVAHGAMMMPLSYYQAEWESGKIGGAELTLALEQARTSLPFPQAEALESYSVETLLAALSAPVEESPNVILTVADCWDRNYGTQWRSFIVDDVSKWCSAYFDAGQASWRMPWRDLPLFTAWKQAALLDANPEMMGLSGFRGFVAALPDEPTQVIAAVLQTLQVRPDGATEFLHRQLMSIAGWSGYVQYQVREKGLHGESDDMLGHLLAIRLAYEGALHQKSAPFGDLWAQHLASWQGMAAEVQAPALHAYVWQLAAEIGFQKQLMQKIVQNAQAASSTDAPAAANGGRSAVQAVFCIDVRSEVLRRGLEAQSPDIETIGFAGFFGFPIKFVPFGQREGRAQCPVLLTPSFRIEEGLPGASAGQTEAALQGNLFAGRVRHAWNSFKTSAVSCFAFVETGGLLSGVKLVQDSLGKAHHGDSSAAMAPCVHQETLVQGEASGMSLEQQIATAANALKHMGLTTNLARLVMLCGHGSSTTNNPYGAGLDCGACGGHSGQANARVAVAVLNNPLVRAGLKARGIIVPEDTHFIAAEHNTTTDDVRLFEVEATPVTHAAQLKEWEQHLVVASAQVRRERAAHLGLADAADAEVDALVRARSLDWAQTRPEWGLAGNAAFVAAPRQRTRFLNLGGRVFLNNYDYRSDTDWSKLELVMTAPMVVASWINLQYFASTVNNRSFGSGNKVLHNVVGTIGVWQGNCGDLQVGLPLQSVHDGHEWRHEPLRLSVFIEAPREAIGAMVAKHQGLQHLLDNGWVHLFAMEEEGQRFVRYSGKGGWETEGGR